MEDFLLWFAGGVELILAGLSCFLFTKGPVSPQKGANGQTAAVDLVMFVYPPISACFIDAPYGGGFVLAAGGAGVGVWLRVYTL